MLLKRLLLIGFAGLSLLFAQDNEYCMECHSDDGLTKFVNDTLEVSLFVDLDELNHSIHADFECMDCHTVSEDHPDEGSVGPLNCAACHVDAQEEYVQSVHGIATTLKGISLAATCADCHGRHDIKSSYETDSKTHHANLAQTCGNCHSRPEVNLLLGTRNINRVDLYENSVHGRKNASDPQSLAATCTDCHDYHLIKPALDPTSPVNVFNVAQTCGNCHEKARDEYHESIHWSSLKRGKRESPTCTGCHGEHQIQQKTGTAAGLNGALESTRVCASCHSSEVLMSRFGLDHERFATYMKSYHGLAVLRSSPDAATCSSCHEVHAIRSSIDPNSSIHADNLLETCGQCHQNITPTFAQIDVHPRDQQSRNPIAYFFRVFYTWFIVILIGGMCVHNFIIVLHHIQEKRRQKKYAVTYQRFQTFEVYQHMLMFLSFTLLVITGFALKFPDAGWSKLLLTIGLDEPMRSLLHRIGAVVMITVSVIQLIYFTFTKKGRHDFKSLIPNGDDFLHFFQNMGYYLGLRKTKPKFDRYDYTEKAEYLALIWGVGVMAFTGFILWFPEFFMRYFPIWAFETAEVIHYYEAWLATLAILVWHWFFVIYHPEKYPMSVTWMDGRITEDEFKHHHSLEFERLQKEELKAAEAEK